MSEKNEKDREKGLDGWFGSDRDVIHYWEGCEPSKARKVVSKPRNPEKPNKARRSEKMSKEMISLLIRLKQIRADEIDTIDAYLEANKPEPVRQADIKDTLSQVQQAFPQELQGMLYFEVTPDWIVIKPRQYLGSEHFGNIAAIVRDKLKGEYISAGKDSHFRVSTTERVGIPTLTKNIGFKEPEKIPEFDMADLMKHQWKSKKIGQGQYAEGSLSWGWDFPNTFKESTIIVLKKGSVENAGYVFSYNLERNLVQTQKVKA